MVVNTQSVPLSGAARQPRIWAVGGGKGGVGKSFISANLGVALGRHGKRVVLVDLDLGGANMHTCLGLSSMKGDIGGYLSEGGDINDFVNNTGYEGVGLISGAADNHHVANLKYFQKTKLLRNLSHIDADYVILDLGAGTTFNTLDFFVQAERGLLSVTPDPASIENTYRFLKCVFMRRLKAAPESVRQAMIDVLTSRQRPTGERIQTIADVLSTMDEQHPEDAPRLRKSLESSQLHLIVNQVLEPGDTELGHAMQMTCNRYFGANVDYLGCLQHDTRVLRSLRRREPFLVTYPQSMVAIYLEKMAATLIAQDEQGRR